VDCFDSACLLVIGSAKYVLSTSGAGAAMPLANVNGIRLYYQAHGQGEVLLLIPGLGAGHEAWFRQLHAFRNHFRVVTFDPRSIGKSDRPKQPYGFRSLADDIVCLMDHLSVGKAHILGQSLGGIVAQEVAVDYPDRVMKLVLVSSGIAGGDDNFISPALMETMGIRVFGQQIDFSKLKTGKTMATLIGLSFHKRLYRTAMQLLSRFFVKPEMFDGLSDQIRAVTGHSTIDRLHLVKARTLVITGADDKIVSPRASEVLAAKIPNARLVMVKGGSHGFNVEMTSRFNREVLGFLRAL
jgi:3-oxoadipate enol-lactonase